MFVLTVVGVAVCTQWHGCGRTSTVFASRAHKHWLHVSCTFALCGPPLELRARRFATRALSHTTPHVHEHGITFDLLARCTSFCVTALCCSQFAAHYLTLGASVRTHFSSVKCQGVGHTPYIVAHAFLLGAGRQAKLMATHRRAPHSVRSFNHTSVTSDPQTWPPFLLRGCHQSVCVCQCVVHGPPRDS